MQQDILSVLLQVKQPPGS